MRTGYKLISLVLPDPRRQPVIAYCMNNNGLATRVWQCETTTDGPVIQTSIRVPWNMLQNLSSKFPLALSHVGTT